MATLADSLKVFGQIVLSIDKMQQNMTQMMTAMQKVRNKAKNNKKMANNINTTWNSLMAINKDIDNMVNHIKSLTTNKENAGEKEEEKKKKSLLATLLKNPAMKVLNMAKKLVTDSFNKAMKNEQIMFNMKGLLQNDQAGEAFFKQLQQQANASKHSLEDFSSVSMKMMKFTTDTDKLQKLVNLTERLTLMDPSQNFEGTGAALNKALSGDFASLQSEFGFSKADQEILKASNSLDEFIANFDTLLNQKGLTDQMLQNSNQTTGAQLGMLKSNVSSAFEQLAGQVMTAIFPLISFLNEAFQSGQFQPFFDAISAGLDGLGQAFMWVLENGIPLFENLLNSFIMIIPLIMGAATAWLTYTAIVQGVAKAKMVYEKVTKAMTAAFKALNAAMRANPIGFIISLIIGIITAMAAFGNITGGIRQIFSSAFGFIMDVAETAVNFIIGLINGAIKGINTVSGFFADLLGFDVTEIQEIEVRADFSKAKEAGQDFIENFSLDSIKEQFGLDRLSNLTENNQPPKDTWEKFSTQQDKLFGQGNSEIGKVGEIGGTVDISSEDLRLMRDLAEMKSIQNFVTLTPTVQVSTGDINNGYDIDTIIQRIEQSLENEIVSSAEGVYT